MSEDVFKDLGFSDEEAANLRARSALMAAVEQEIKARGLTQQAAAELLGVRQPRVSALMNGKIELFSVDMLMTMAARLGLTVSVEVKRAA